MVDKPIAADLQYQDRLIAYVIAILRIDRQAAMLRLNQWSPGWQGHDEPAVRVIYQEQIEESA